MKRFFFDTNQPIFLIPFTYFKVASKYEKAFDIGVPIALTFLLAIIGWFYVTDLPKFLATTKDINNVIVAMLSILASFNMASVAIFATSTSPLIIELAGKPLSNDPSKTQFEQIITFFCWAIVLQLMLLVICFVYYFVSGFLIPNSPYSYLGKFPFNWFVPLWIFVFIWLSATLHSIFVSVRNVAALFLYIVAASKKS